MPLPVADSVKPPVATCATCAMTGEAKRPVTTSVEQIEATMRWVPKSTVVPPRSPGSPNHWWRPTYGGSHPLAYITSVLSHGGPLLASKAGQPTRRACPADPAFELRE